MGTLNYTVIIQMMNLTVYKLRAVDDTVTYLIEDCNEFYTTRSINVVLKYIQKYTEGFYF